MVPHLGSGIGLRQICRHNLRHNRLTFYASIMPAFWDSILEYIVIFSKLSQDGVPVSQQQLFLTASVFLTQVSDGDYVVVVS